MSSTTAASVAAAGKAPPYDPRTQLYDMDTFWGRLLHRCRLIDPRGLWYGEQQLREMQKHLEAASKGDRGKLTDEELWHMKFMVEGCVHPTTNEIIPRLCRISAFIPVNVPITLTVMTPTVINSTALTTLAHFTNQTYASGLNYANRSGDSQPVETLGKAYIAAVATSLTGGLSATFALRRIGGTGPMATVIRATLPFAAVVGSGCVNLAIMRWPEWQREGVPVTDEEGNVRGHSIAAGRRGILQCCLARCMWNAPPMILPPFVSAQLAGIPVFAHRARAVEAVACLASQSVAFPAASAYFKPYTTIEAGALEPEFQALKLSDGRPVKEYTFYKGI